VFDLLLHVWSIIDLAQFEVNNSYKNDATVEKDSQIIIELSEESTWCLICESSLDDDLKRSSNDWELLEVSSSSSRHDETTCLTCNQSRIKCDIIIPVSHFIETFSNSSYADDNSDQVTNSFNDFHFFSSEESWKNER